MIEMKRVNSARGSDTSGLLIRSATGDSFPFHPLPQGCLVSSLSLSLSFSLSHTHRVKYSGRRKEDE